MKVLYIMQKICFLICGLPRTINLIISSIEYLFDLNKYEIHYYICSSNLSEKEYLQEPSYWLHNQNPRIKNILLLSDDCESSFRNSINYFKKLSYGLKMIEPIYSLYFIIRSDFIFENIDLFKNDLESDVIYFSLNHKNCYTKNIVEKINEQIIFSSNYQMIHQLSKIYEFSLKYNNYADIILYHFIKENNLKYKTIHIDYKIVLSKCNIIAISGDSGSGKTTLMKYLKHIFGNNTIQFETDRYHKWERGNENYKTYTHLNPFSNHLEIMNSDVYNLKIGNDIFQVDYDHNSGKFTGKQQIVPKDNVILCGLHTLYSNKINQILDLKIFMDTDRELIKSWKIKRDISKRGYSVEQITKQIKDRESDYYEFIDHQKNNADIIVRFYGETTVKCQLIIQNNSFFNKISSILIKYNYSTEFLNSTVIIELSNNYKQIIIGESLNEIASITETEVEDIMHKYYYEILAIILFYISPIK